MYPRMSASDDPGREATSLTPYGSKKLSSSLTIPGCMSLTSSSRICSRENREADESARPHSQGQDAVKCLFSVKRNGHFWTSLEGR